MAKGEISIVILAEGPAHAVATKAAERWQKQDGSYSVVDAKNFDPHDEFEDFCKREFNKGRAVIAIVDDQYLRHPEYGDVRMKDVALASGALEFARVVKAQTRSTDGDLVLGISKARKQIMHDAVRLERWPSPPTRKALGTSPNFHRPRSGGSVGLS